MKVNISPDQATIIISLNLCLQDVKKKPGRIQINLFSYMLVAASPDTKLALKRI